MIGRLFGKIVAEDSDGTVILDVGGVGYELLVPLGALGRAHADEGGRVTLFVHTHAREDVLALYGFPSEADRAAFRVLLGVSNVGPKTALAVLGALPANELARVVGASDLKALTAIPGVGKKTAEVMLVQLRDKAPALGGDAARAGPPRVAAAPGRGLGKNADLVASALVGLGYRAADAERAVAALGERVATGALPELLREALAVLAK